MSTTTVNSINKIDFDSPWKNILDNYLKDFLSLCFPAIAAEIDWDRKYEILDKELLALHKHSLTGNRIADKLFKVWLKSGAEVWLLLHIEVQGKRENDFALRMMVYHNRIFDRYQKAVVSIAILTDRNSRWRPNNYHAEQWGCRIEMQFLTVKLIDYRSRIGELENSTNPFSMVILAHLAALEKYHDDKVKLATKKNLTRMLYQKGWNKDQVLDLYRFLDCLLTLPESLEIEYHEAINRIEDETQMQYITTAERIGIKKGLQQGLQEGMQQGMQRGMLKGRELGLKQGELLLLIKQIQIKFKLLPDTYHDQLTKADQETLLKIAEKILDANSLEEIFN